MKKNDIIDLRSKTIDELRRTLADLVSEFEKIKIEKIAGKLSNHNAIKNKRRDIARVKTFLTLKSYENKMEEIKNG